jgi:hypothetical protein
MQPKDTKPNFGKAAFTKLFHFSRGSEHEEEKLQAVVLSKAKLGYII